MDMNKVVVAMDSFKGSLSAFEAVSAVAEAVESVFPQCDIVGVPLSDGGEGMLHVVVENLGGSVGTLDVPDPLMRMVGAEFGRVGDIAVVEMASAAGLTLLAKQEQSALKTTTYGVGVLLRHIVDLGYKRIVLGLGGSATNDAGLGALQALGLRCFDWRGCIIEEPIRGIDLKKIAHFDTTLLNSVLCGVDIKMICDVSNSFCGTNGAAYVFAPQKGASAEEVKVLDAGLRHVAEVMQKQLSIDISDLEGAGAAGGMSGTFMAFLDATIKKGIDEVLEIVRFDDKLQSADLVICGEGCVDSQSLMGKVISGVLSKVSKQGVPLLVVGGKVMNGDAVIKAGAMDIIQATPSDMPYSLFMQPDMAYRNIVTAVEKWMLSKIE